MLNNIRDKGKVSGSLKGEVDTSAPFQSVKDAVSLFGEVKVSKNRPLRRARPSSEFVLDKETQLILAQKEIERMKMQLERADITRARALGDLERAKRSIQELTMKLKNVRESKESALEAAQNVKKKAEQLEVAKSQNNMGGEVEREQQVDIAREHYALTATEIDAAKQELNKIRHDIDATLEAKQAAFQQAAEAQRSAKVSSERVVELRKELSAMKEGINQMKLAAQQASEEQSKIVSEKDALMQSYKVAKEAADNKLNSLKKVYDPELTGDLEIKVAETTEMIEVLQKQRQQAHAAEMDSMKAVTTELNEATKTLQEVLSSLRNLVSSLNLELKDVKEYAEIKEKEAEMEAKKESIAKEYAAAKEKELECEDTFNKHNLKLEKLASEAETARNEEEKIKIEVENLKQTAEAARMLAEEEEKNLLLALSEVKEAKASERKALDELHILSNRPDSASNLIITKEEFESLNKKVDESGAMAEKKLAEAEAQLLVINARKNEADKKLEANLTAIEEIKTATEVVLQSAETAAAAQSMVEDELRRWRQQEALMTAALVDSVILEFQIPLQF